MTDRVVICSAARTPIGDFLGQFSTVTAPALGSVAIQSAVSKAKLSPEDVGEVIMGCVLSAGQGQAPARQAALGAGLLQETPCTTINKMCGSGMKAIMMGMDAILSSRVDCVVAGGLENMSLAPHLLSKTRSGCKMGHQTISDHMFLDGLEDAYDKGTLMGVFAEATAQKYAFSRQAQDDFALTSLERANQAISSGAFEQEIASVPVQHRKQITHIAVDELPGKARPDKIPTLRPAFDKAGTVTAANSSALSDGASAVVLMRESVAKARGLPILGAIVAQSSSAHAPAWFTTAPVKAISSVLEQANWSVDDTSLFEVNEAFAVVTMAAMHDLKLPHDKVNIRGGACSLGHPIGASGARIVTTLLHALADTQQKRGIAALCIGGGEGCALAIERI